jgi:ADP-ribose pyrophosphatase
LPQSNEKRLVRSDFALDDVHIKAQNTPYKGYASVKEFHLSHKKFDGGMSPEITRELFVSGDAVVVIPFDPDAQTILLIEQFRVAPLHRGNNPWVIEGIAGRIDEGETPHEVASREALEEAGCVIEDLEEIGGYFQSPGIFAEHITYFCAKADLSNCGGVYGLEEEAEDIRAFVVPLDLAIEALDNGEIETVPTALCLHWMARHRDRLTKAWRSQ